MPEVRAVTETAMVNFSPMSPKLVRTYPLADSGIFLDFLYQSGVKSTVSGVFKDLKFKISEGYKQN